MERLELTILRNLVFNEDYARKVIPFIQPEYYEQRVEKIVFEEIVKFIVKYGSSITIEALNIEIDNRRDLTESENKEIVELLSKLTDSPVDNQWILDTTEKCVVTVLFTWHLWNLFILPMVRMIKKVGMLFPVFFLMLWQYLLIII
jgi:hypothetical protein